MPSAIENLLPKILPQIISLLTPKMIKCIKVN